MTQPLDMLIFGAHPDDAEIGMGATIAKHTAAGLRVGICDLTYAEMSSNGTVDTRNLEAAAAARILGLAERTNLGLPDRGLSMTAECIAPITEEIRKFRPRVVLAPYWQDRHPDHVTCSHLVQEAVFNAKLRKYLPNTPPHTVERLYFYFINDIHEADMVVDVSGNYDKKTEALRAFASQFEPASASNGFVPTPINQGYVERVEARDRLMGQRSGVAYAEGFVSKQPLFIDLF